MDALMVSSLIIASIHVYIAGGKIGCWSFLILESVGAISEIQTPIRHVQGRLILTKDHKGKFTVKYTHRMSQEHKYTHYTLPNFGR